MRNHWCRHRVFIRPHSSSGVPSFTYKYDLDRSDYWTTVIDEETGDGGTGFLTNDIQIAILALAWYGGVGFESTCYLDNIKLTNEDVDDW